MEEEERELLHKQVLKEFKAMGYKPEKVESLRLIEKALANTLCRIGYEGNSYVLKTYYKPENAVELKCYGIFKDYDVPTLKVFARTESAILLEDLETSSTSRLGEEKDMSRPEVGRSVAEWYLRLHKAGRSYFKSSSGVPAFLKRDADRLNASVLIETGKRLGLESLGVWKLAAENIEAMKKAVRSCAETIDHNDFHWTNLALSRVEGPECSAVLFDYHLPKLGMAYSDCRRISGVLKEPARAAFWERYGAPNEKERILDKPVSMLYALFDVSEFDRSRFPKYAKEYLEQTERGELEKSIKRALKVI